MSEFTEIFNLVIPYVIGLSILGVSAKIVYSWIQNKFKFEQTKVKMEGSKKSDLNTISGKIKFGIENTDLAYEQIQKKITEANMMIKSTDPQMKMKGESMLKGAQQELKMVEFIMKNKSAFDMAGDTIIPLAESFEKKIRTFAKGGLKDYL